MDSREKQPFISYSGGGASVVPINASPEVQRRHRRRRPKCVVCWCLLCLLLVLFIIPLFVIFIISIWPYQCFHLLDDSAPIQLGVNIQQDKLFVIFNKPLVTGVFNSSLNFCGKSSKADTRFLPVIGSFRAPAATFVLGSSSCSNLPIGMDFDRGTIKFIIDGSNQTNVTIEDVHVKFDAEDLPSHGYFELISDNNQIQTPTTKQVRIKFLKDGKIRFQPGIGAIYSRFQAVITEEISILSEDSSENYCGAPAVGIKLEAGVFSKAWQAFRHWVYDAFEELSPIGISQHIFALSSLKLDEVELQTQPILLKAQSKVHPKHMPIFLRNGELQIDKSSVSLSNLSLKVGENSKQHNETFFRTKARIKLDLPLGDVDAVATFKKRLEVMTSFRNGHLDLPFDVNLSNGEGEFNITANGTEEISENSGEFQMQNITLKAADNSSLFTPSLEGIVEPIYVRSARKIIFLPGCQEMLYKFITVDFVTAAMTVPAGKSLKVIVAGSTPGATPLTVNLYQMGRVANSMRMIVSSVCLDEKLEIRTPEKRHYRPQSEALLTSDSKTFSYNYNISLGDLGDDDDAEATNSSMKLQYFQMNAQEVDARVEPIGNLLQIDKILVNLNTTNEKANLDLQVGLKQSPTPLLKATL